MLRRRNATGEEHRQHLGDDSSHFLDSWGAQQNSEQEERAGWCFFLPFSIFWLISFLQNNKGSMKKWRLLRNMKC